VLLSRLAPSVAEGELWTLPGGGIDFGEHPDDAVVREVHEETGLTCEIGRPLWIGSAHRVVDRQGRTTELHSLRIVYDAWVPADAPAPRVLEVDGSTIDARWVDVVDVEAEVVATVPMVRAALARHQPAVRQRLAAYAVIVRDDAVLLTRHSVHGPRPGAWSLPGGGVDHGEAPAVAVVREVLEETSLVAEVGALLGAYDEHFTGTAPSGREEDFHGIALVYAAHALAGTPAVRDREGTTDAVAWASLADVRSGQLPLSPLVPAALAMRSGEAPA